MTARVDAATNHVSYHVERARLVLSQVARTCGRMPEFGQLVAILYDLQMCATDQHTIAGLIMAHAEKEEPTPRNCKGCGSGWRAAARSLHELAGSGPCGHGDRGATRVADPHTLVSASPRTGVVAIDADYRIRNWSPEIESFTGIVAPNALEENIFDVLPSSRYNGAERRVRDAMDGRVATPETVQFVSRLGYYGAYKVINYPWKDECGKIVGALASIRLIGDARRG